MKKEELTKAQLIETGKELSLNLNMKMLKKDMLKAIEAEQTKSKKNCKKKKEIEAGDLVVLINKVSECGCSYVYPKTIAKVLRKENKLRAFNIRFCNSGCIIWVTKEDLRMLTKEEAVYAEKRFSNATAYRYATVD